MRLCILLVGLLVLMSIRPAPGKLKNRMLDRSDSAEFYVVNTKSGRICKVISWLGLTAVMCIHASTTLFKNGQDAVIAKLLTTWLWFVGNLPAYILGSYTLCEMFVSNCLHDHDNNNVTKYDICVSVQANLITWLAEIKGLADLVCNYITTLHGKSSTMITIDIFITHAKSLNWQ